jgi:glycosyltransferase involved in cell wall biosynthesis
MKKPRLAIISTFDDLCGIAGYTRFLVPQIEDDFDVEIFDLNQFFMRGTNKSVMAAADAMIKEFCARAATFDFVNIQLEFGTLGRSRKEIVRRFRWIAEAAPALSVTFHTILPEAENLGAKVSEALQQFRVYDAVMAIRDHSDREALKKGIYSCLRAEAKKKQVNVIVHTRRDALIMKHVNGLPNVYDHPLSFLGDEQAAQIRATASVADFPILENLPADAKTIGVFGFLSEYKGFDTVVRALQFLPENYHLIFFGGVHPNEIRKKDKIYSYVRHLLELAHVDSTIADIRPETAHPGVSLHLDLPVSEDHSRKAFLHPLNVAHRIHFLGAQSDENFARGMSLCDCVVLPYLEVGQSASGPISIALEMGTRVIAARNRAFLQFVRYYPDCIELFEIGNHVELAERIRSRPAHPAETRVRGLGTHTNRELYRMANTRHDGR